MFSWSHLFVGLIVTAVGVLLLRYNFKIVGYTGRQDWIESKLGSGSTYFAYQIFAIIVTVGGLLYATGLGNGVLTWIFSPLQGIFGSHH